MAVPAATAARPAAATAPARRARPQPKPVPRRKAPSRSARSRGLAPATGRPSRAPMPARLVPLAVGRTVVAISGIAESALVRRLTRGRLWIGLLTTLLVGIVALNVFALSFNAAASRTGRQADALERENSILRGRLAEAGASSQRVQGQAQALGLIVPEPGSISYLTSRPDNAAVAAKRIASGKLTGPEAAAAP